MCGGPSYEEKVQRAEAARQQALAAEQQREQAQIQQRQALEERAAEKRSDIEAAVSARDASRERRSGRMGAGSRAGGAGRRSLFTSPTGGSGYASRF